MAPARGGAHSSDASGRSRWRAIAADLERQIQFLVDTYKCEWREVVEDPEKRRLFRQFVNTEETEPTIEFVTEREQHRPTNWSYSFIPSADLSLDLLPAGRKRR